MLNRNAIKFRWRCDKVQLDLACRLPCHIMKWKFCWCFSFSAWLFSKVCSLQLGKDQLDLSEKSSRIQQNLGKEN